VTETILRALIESGERWDDPSEDLLFDLLSDIEAGEGSFLIVERAADVNGQTYSQALHLEDGRYAVEHREGSAERHYATTVADFRAAHAVLTGWAFDMAGWQDTASWDRVSQ
jgi:hypothetical protein